MSQHTESFYHIPDVNKFILKEKSSEFIGIIFPCFSSESAGEVLHSLRKEYFDATHHCYAYRMYGAGLKYSDDGEPSGTAGVRILNAIEHFGIYNNLLVIIRYFGGIKLGVGPLGQAYYNCAFTLCEQSKREEVFPAYNGVVSFPFSESGTIYRLLDTCGVKITNTNYAENSTSVEFLIKLQNSSTLERELSQLFYKGISYSLNKDSIFFF